MLLFLFFVFHAPTLVFRLGSQKSFREKKFTIKYYKNNTFDGVRSLDFQPLLSTNGVLTPEEKKYFIYHKNLFKNYHFYVFKKYTY